MVDESRACTFLMMIVTTRSNTTTNKVNVGLMVLPYRATSGDNVQKSGRERHPSAIGGPNPGHLVFSMGNMGFFRGHEDMPACTNTCKPDLEIVTRVESDKPGSHIPSNRTFFFYVLGRNARIPNVILSSRNTVHTSYSPHEAYKTQND